LFVLIYLLGIIVIEPSRLALPLFLFQTIGFAAVYIILLETNGPTYTAH
jgi:hypothetical protein